MSVPAVPTPAAELAANATWHCLASAHTPVPADRLPWAIDGQPVGSVARAHLPALLAWPDVFVLANGRLDCTDANALPRAVAALHSQGLISGWRNETYAIRSLAEGLGAPSQGRVLAQVERASCFFFGFLTQAAHATGYVPDAAGRPQALWIARRALSKATDPGKLDNLVGGGIPHGQTPRQAFEREAWEEAGLRGDVLEGAPATGGLLTQRAVPQGWQHEVLHCFDIALAPGQTPHNQDGEVAGFECLRVHHALALARSAEMTIDAALVTLDFALRHGLLPEGEAAACRIALAPLRWPAAR